MNRVMVVSLSGGMDSATVLWYALQQTQTRNIRAVCFQYGSKHNPFELLAARARSKEARVELLELSVPSLFCRGSSALLQEGGVIPEGHYTDASMSQTVVPGRNLIFTSILAGLCEAWGGGMVALGIHQGDHAIYPDCRLEFFDSANRTVQLSSDGGVSLVAPFLATNKGGILRRGLMWGVPYHLTRTCYKAQALACGKCGSCVERLEAFASCGVSDPVPYQT